MKHRRKKIDGQFAPRTIEMLRSPAFRALSLTGHRILARIELELASHGGKDNGKLPITHQNFVQFGIHDHAVGPGIREIEALGFGEVTQRGVAGNADYRRPNMFRLTYRPTDDRRTTDEWRRISTVKEARAIAANARRIPRQKARHSYWRKTRKPLAETNSGKPGFSLAETTSDDPEILPSVTASTF